MILPVIVMMAIDDIIIAFGCAQRRFFSGMLCLFTKQRFAIFLRDLIVIGVDFRKGEEAVTVSAVIDKRRLKRRLDPCYFGEVDISFELATFRRFKIKFLNLVSLDHRNPGFLRVAGVDQHPHCHYRISVRDLSHR